LRYNWRYRQIIFYLDWCHAYNKAALLFNSKVSHRDNSCAEEKDSLSPNKAPQDFWLSIFVISGLTTPKWA
jgi:hypothetical protein